LGLGDLILKDKERIHPNAGRLDLLFQDSDSERRYEVEVQLGKVDESHIIRTIEYWDIERKRYPNYQHYAVIIAEDITNRFLNVISLLNKTVPLIVIKMGTYKYQDNYWLTFTTIMNEVRPDLIEEEEIKEVTDRNYWEKRGTSTTVALADELLNIIREFDKDYELKYNKFYIGLAKNGQPDNFVIFNPQKQSTTMKLKLESSEEIDKLIEEAGLDLMEYDGKWGRYRIRISEKDLHKNKELITNLLKMAPGKNIEA
jgi:predicted transport protein